MTIRLGISTEPMGAGVSRMFMSLTPSWPCLSRPSTPSWPENKTWMPGTSPGMTRASSQHRDLAAVEVDGGAGEPGGARGEDEGHEVGHVLDRAEPRDAGLAAQPLADFRFRLSGAFDLGADAPPLPLGLDQARMDAVDLHAVLFAEVGEALGEGRDRGIDGAADGKTFFRLAPAGAADGNQRAAAFLEQRPSGAREPHMRKELERITFLPVGIGEGKKIAAPGGPGVVDENVEVAEFAACRLDQGRRRARVAQIGDMDRGPAAV